MNPKLSPSDSTGRASMISMQVVRTLAEALTQAGVPCTTFLQAARLEASQLHHLDDRVPRSKLYDLCELALSLTGDPAFALRSVERLPSDALNPIGALVSHATTLQEALAAIQEFRGLLGDEPSFRVYEDNGKVIVKANPVHDDRPHVQRYMAEVTIAGLYSIITHARSSARIDHVAFAYPAPEYEAEYTRIFGGHARFDQPFTGLCFDSELMTAAAQHADPELHQALRVFARRRVRQRTNQEPYASRVHEFLVWQPTPRSMTMQTAARALGTSVRSLRRYLTAEGKSYASVVSEAQAVIAKNCLRDETRTISETASELGFADATGFHRAFKRWTGLTPTEFRKQQAAVTNANGSSFEEHESRGVTGN